MNTARRRQQGYRVNKREIQDPLSSFAQNGMKNPPVDPLDYLQPEISPFVRGMKEASEFNDTYNDIMYALAGMQRQLDRGESLTPRGPSEMGVRVIKGEPQSNYITAADIAALADQRAGDGAIMSFDDLMAQIAFGESGNKNIFQDAPRLRQSKKAQGEYQMEAAARQDANNYAAALAKGMGKDFVPFTDEQLSDIVNNLTADERALLAYSYMYGPERVKTADVLTGQVGVPEFWMQNWNKGTTDRTEEFRKRLKNFPGE